VPRPLFRVKRCKVYTTASSSVRFLILGRAPSFQTAHRQRILRNFINRCFEDGPSPLLTILRY